ncbi:MAG: Capsule polysaccharide export protein [Candidatus Ozemobacter sibiricus]|uniref:Capsule polysaccharide export protein n=1 Tax=Candidatus Ozemobacter sibiricus TaxID=2268124 RepID=A0A367ZUE3_9BACT|nr:MAG: Capsule polysaccharide export protein [Candidatus Ozemobacter sibiricus]
MEAKRREELRQAEKRKIFKGDFGARRGKFREREHEPGEVTAIDEARIERELGTDLQRQIEVEPFGRAFFLKGEDISASLETVSAPSSYVLGPGDALKIIIWSELGDETVYDVTVNPEGQVYIPILGIMRVAGQTVGQFQETVLGTLAAKFPHFKGQVTLSKVRTLQIFMAGEVRRPGAMMVSALATAFHALYRAGGPTDRGTMRRIRVLRGAQPIAEIDLYEYFLNGDKSQDVNLESGDTIFVPPVGGRVTIKGEVIRPGIFEILAEKTLADVLAMAGGIDASAYTGRVRVFRWQGGSRRLIHDVGAGQDGGALASFQIRPGDEIEVERAIEEVGNRVRIQGAVLRPGEYAATPGTTVSQVIAKAGGVAAEAALGAGQIIRKLAEGREEILTFHLGRALEKRPEDDLPVKAYDRIKIFFANEIEADTKRVTIAGAVRRPGEYILRKGMTIRDLILLAQGLTADASGEAEVASAKDSVRGSDVRRVTLEQLMKNPKSPQNLVLNPLDKVNVFSRGDRLLEPETVILAGEVKRPGPYALRHPGETLREVIARAGGLTSRAFPEGAVFMRRVAKVAPESQIQAAERVREELYQQATLDLQADLLRAGASLPAEKDKVAPVRPIDKTILADSPAIENNESTPTSVGETSQFAGLGYSSRSLATEAVRIPIRLAEILKQGSGRREEDVVLEDGDQITIPAIPTTVSVVGAVVSPTTLPYRERKGPRHYIDLAGGFTSFANHARTVVVKPNGEVLPLRRVREIARGDIILVPPKARLVRPDKLKDAGQIAQILGNLAVMYKVVVDLN